MLYFRVKLGCHAAAAAKSLQLCPTLCDPMNRSTPGISIHHQRPLPITSGNISVEHNVAASAKSLQSCPTLCDPIDGSPPGSPVPGIL